MFPVENLFSMPIFAAEIKQLVREGRGAEYVEALRAMKKDAGKRDQLLRFVSLRYLSVYESHFCV